MEGIKELLLLRQLRILSPTWPAIQDYLEKPEPA